MAVNNVETLLVVDDDEAFLTLTAGVLERAGYETLGAASVEEARTYLNEQFVDLVLIDEELGRESGVRFLDYARVAHPGLTSIVVSGGANLRLAQRAMRAGAADILSKPVGEAELLDTLRRGLDSTTLAREARRNRWMAEKTARPPEIVGNSNAIRAVLELVGKVAGTNATVLIEGETELVKN